MIDREACSGEDVAEQLQRRLAADSVPGDRLAREALQLRMRLLPVERDGIEAETLFGVGENRLCEALGLVGVLVHAPSLRTPRQETTSETDTNCVAAAATTSTWKISWKPNVAGNGFGQRNA